MVGRSEWRAADSEIERVGTGIDKGKEKKERDSERQQIGRER